MINKLYIDDNIYLFDELDEEKKSYNIFIHITNYQITSKLLNYEFVDGLVNLYFENYVSLRIKRINNCVKEYQLFLNVITFQNFIKNNLIEKIKNEENNILHKVSNILNF